MGISKDSERLRVGKEREPPSEKEEGGKGYPENTDAPCPLLCAGERQVGKCARGSERSPQARATGKGERGKKKKPENTERMR